MFCIDKLQTSWNTAIRILFGLSRQTHRYVIGQISDQIHLKTMFGYWVADSYHFANLSVRVPSSASDYCLIYAKYDQRAKLCKSLSNASLRGRFAPIF